MSKKYYTIVEISEMAGVPFTVGQLRNFLLFRHKNGLDKAVRKVGKNLYIRLDLFEEWMESFAQ